MGYEIIMSELVEEPLVSVHLVRLREVDTYFFLFFSFFNESVTAFAHGLTVLSGKSDLVVRR